MGEPCGSLCGMAQILIDVAFQILREYVLQFLGLLMDSVPWDTEGPVQICLQEPMVSNHLQGGGPPGLGQCDSLIRFIGHPLPTGKLLEHASHGRG